MDASIVKKIEEFVYQKPRSIQEIAQHINKNWRTADRYVLEIEKETGTLSTRVFRGGTRGALKIVYWASMEKISSSAFQEQLEAEIMRARWKEDFSAFDIFQYVNNKHKKATVESEQSEQKVAFHRIKDMLEKTEKQLLIFSGNLSFINYKNKNERILDIFDKLVKKGISIKVICRVDISGRKNVEGLLSLNHKYGKELVEIHNRHHPIRATIVDKKFFDIKEIKEPTGEISELDKKIFIFYNITEKDWIDWLTKIFWKLFSSSIDSKTRLQELEKIKRR
ncbi:MAG: hypothetical protein AABW80_02585 [Nanoarchaeota archaeon]